MNPFRTPESITVRPESIALTAESIDVVALEEALEAMVTAALVEAATNEEAVVAAEETA